MKYFQLIFLPKLLPNRQPVNHNLPTSTVPTGTLVGSHIFMLMIKIKVEQAEAGFKAFLAAQWCEWLNQEKGFES